MIDAPRTWDRYYDRMDVRTFGDAVPLYRGMVQRLADVGMPHSGADHPFLRTDNGVFVLGGFYSPDSLHEADQLVVEIAAGVPYSLIAVDKNSQPFTQLVDVAGHITPVQGNLETLDLGGLGADAIFLDFTFNFMSPDQLKAFFSNVGSVLAQDGVVIAGIDLSTSLKGLLRGHSKVSCFDGVDRFEYTERALIEAARAGGLKCVMAVEWKAHRGRVVSGFAFAKDESRFPEDSVMRIFPELSTM